MVKLQRSYRLLSYVYSHFGATLFVDSYGNSMSGRIAFESSPKRAQWIAVAPSSSVPKLCRFIDKFWNLARPEVIISIAGGGDDFDLPTPLQLVFERGLVSAARSAKAWVLTTGMDAGVSKLVGDVFHRYDVGLPIIGFMPWGFVNGREQLARASGGVGVYQPRPQSEHGAPLNPHHTHFMFVDDGKEGAACWEVGPPIDTGSGTPQQPVTPCQNLRIGVEARVAAKKNIALVQLVVHGGPSTLSIVHKAALAGKPIVVLAESGGAATAIYKFCCEGGADAVEPQYRATAQMLQQLEAVKQLNAAYAGKQLTFFRLEGGGATGAGARHRDSPDLSSALLEAVVKMMHAPSAYDLIPIGSRVRHPKHGTGTLTRFQDDGRRVVEFDNGDTHRYAVTSMHKLLFAGQGMLEGGPTSGLKTDDKLLAKTLVLTVVWNRHELARKILAGLGGKREAGMLPAVSVTLQRGLELQRENIVQQILELPGISVAHINVGKLYLQPDESRFLSGNATLQNRIRICSYDLSNPLTPQALLYPMYQKAVSRFFYNLSPILLHILRASDHALPRDIFIWLTCHGNEALARSFWPMCEMPVHMALLGSMISRKQAASIVQGQQEALARAARMQAWAIGAMEMAPDEAQAHFVLGQSIRDDKYYTALDIAMHTQAKAFLTQRHCVTLMDKWWRGGVRGSSVVLPPQYSWLALAFFAFFPVFNPHLYEQYDEVVRNRGSAAEEKRGDAGRHVQGMFYDALSLAMKISEGERDRAITARAMQDTHAEDGEHSPGQSATKGRATELKRQASRFKIESAKESDEKEVVMRGRVSSFYSVPAVKFLFRLVYRLCNVGLYITLIGSLSTPDELQQMKDDPDEPCKLPLLSDYKWNEIAWLMFEWGLWIDQRYQVVMRRRTGAPKPEGFNRISIVSDVLLMLALVARIISETAHRNMHEATPSDDGGFACGRFYETSIRAYEGYAVIISIKVILVFLLLFPFLSEWRPLGVLIIVVTRMVNDMTTFIILFMVVTLGFSFSLLGLEYAGHYDRPDSDHWSTNGLFTPFWAVFGEFDMTTWGIFPALVLWTYILIGSVSLVNLLVAMFADTFARVKENSEREYVYLKYMRLFEYRNVLLRLPPVLNAPVILLDFFSSVSVYCRACSKAGSRRLLDHPLTDASSAVRSLRDFLTGAKADERAGLQESFELQREIIRGIEKRHSSCNVESGPADAEAGNEDSIDPTLAARKLAKEQSKDSVSSTHSNRRMSNDEVGAKTSPCSASGKERASQRRDSLDVLVELVHSNRSTLGASASQSKVTRSQSTSPPDKGQSSENLTGDRSTATSVAGVSRGSLISRARMSLAGNGYGSLRNFGNRPPQPPSVLLSTSTSSTAGGSEAAVGSERSNPLRGDRRSQADFRRASRELRRSLANVDRERDREVRRAHGWACGTHPSPHHGAATQHTTSTSLSRRTAPHRTHLIPAGG